VIEVIAPGRWTTIQDQGRPGLERFGIPIGGVADWFSSTAANRLVGNHPGAALIESTSIGPSLRFETDAIVAVTGGDCADTATWRPQPIVAGKTLELGAITPGLRAYVAVRGGVDVPVILGSRSFCQRGAFGGGFGRPLAAGDQLGVSDMTDCEPANKPWPVSHRLPLSGPWEVRAIAGPHLDAFAADAVVRLGNTACRVTRDIDRMGMRLETPALRLRPAEIITTPVTAGAVQVTPSGGLIVLMVDHQTTGGYPVIATVVTADLPLLAQARPGDTVRFLIVDLPEAARARRRLDDWLGPDE